MAFLTLRACAAGEWEEGCPEAHSSGGYFAEGRTRATHLVVIRAQDDPATEGVAQVDHPGAGAEAKHLGQGGLHC